MNRTKPLSISCVPRSSRFRAGLSERVFGVVSGVPRSNSFERVFAPALMVVIAAFALNVDAADIRINVTPIKTQTAEPENRIKKIIEIHKTARPPVIDGKLDDECWKDAAVAESFRQLGSDAPAKEQTTARLTYDDKALYIAFVCNESKMDQILAQKTTHDDGVWQDDCVEIFLDTNHDHVSYHQFIVNSLGARQEGYCDGVGRIDQKWDCDWNAGAAAHKDHWIAEVAIPFASLNAAPGYWGLNLCREERPGGELSCWAKQIKCFASVPEELALFADAIFDNVPFKVNSLFTGNEGWGENLLKMEIGNRTDRDLTCRIEAAAVPPEQEPAVPACPAAKSPSIPLGPKASRSVELPYKIPRLVPGSWRIALSVRNLANDRIYPVGEFPFKVKDASPISISGKVIVGPEYIVPARLRAIIGSLTLKGAACRISVLDPKGTVQAQKEVRMSPDLCEAEVRIDISKLPEGRHVLAAQVVGVDGRPITDKVERTIIKIPGPFEEAGAASSSLVENPSFEVVNKQGDAEGWMGAWWAPSGSGLFTLQPKDFLTVDDATAKDGRRSIRIRSTRGGNAPTGEVLTVRTIKPIPITPGVAYKLTCWWKSDGIVGIGKIWGQTPKRQFVFKGTINGTNPDWIFHQTTFTPDEGETSCVLELSLHGKDGTLWIDEITFGEEEPSIETVLPPNPFHPQGICFLGGNVVGRGLRLAVEAADAGSGQTLGSTTVPVNDKTVRFTLPGFTADRKCRFTAKLLESDGVVTDEKTAMVFGAPLQRNGE